MAEHRSIHQVLPEVGSRCHAGATCCGTTRRSCLRTSIKHRGHAAGPPRHPAHSWRHFPCLGRSHPSLSREERTGRRDRRHLKLLRAPGQPPRLGWSHCIGSRMVDSRPGHSPGARCDRRSQRSMSFEMTLGARYALGEDVRVAGACGRTTGRHRSPGSCRGRSQNQPDRRSREVRAPDPRCRRRARRAGRPSGGQGRRRRTSRAGGPEVGVPHGCVGPGPQSPDARQEVLDRLSAVQRDTGRGPG
jgi:hypothetical protein